MRVLGLLFAVLWLAAPARADFVLSLDPQDECEIGIDLFLSDGASLSPLTDGCAGAQDGLGKEFRHPEAAPDGQSVLAVTDSVGSGLARVPVGGGAPVEVALTEGLSSFNASAPSFGPGGESFLIEGDTYENGYETQPLLEVFLDGSEPRVVHTAPSACPKPRFCSTYENPRWSPDGKLIAVEVSTVRYKPGVPGSLRSGLWLVRYKDGRPVRRLAGRGMSAEWSPDGQRLVYATPYQQREIEGGAAGGNLFVVRRSGGRPRPLVHRENIAETQPAWSPDGKRIAWVSLGFTAGDVSFDVFPSLWSVPAKGGKRRKIQDLPEPYVEEAFYHAPELDWLPG